MKSVAIIITRMISGGVAMAFHDEPRFTQDIDILLAPEDLDRLKTIIKTHGYFESTKPEKSCINLLQKLFRQMTIN